MKLVSEGQLLKAAEEHEALQRAGRDAAAQHDAVLTRVRGELAAVRDELDAAKKTRHVDVAKVRGRPSRLVGGCCRRESCGEEREQLGGCIDFSE